MRLIRLRLEAFGPYLDPEVVDFRSLRNSRLFLIHGPVGSGKTFILDGICFALYGRSSGGERDRAGLRNLSVTPDKDTVVTLDFEAGGQSYRVERRYGAETAEKEGSEEATLSHLPEIGEPTRRDILSATAGGVFSMVTKILGLTDEQFCQVAILPQGRFRRFLLAEVDERREILSNIFTADRHRRFQELLKLSRVAAKAELDAAWKDREQVVARYAGAGGDPREALHRSQEGLKAVEVECRTHQERSVEWERSLEETVRYELLERQREASERELAVLSGGGHDLEDDLSEKLKSALGVYREWRRLMDEAGGITVELNEQRAQYERLKANTNFLEAEVEKARRHEEERFNIQRSLERLRHLERECEGVELLGAEVERGREKTAELTERRSALAATVREDAAKAELLQAELDRVEEAVGRLRELKSQLKAITESQERRKQSAMLIDAHAQQLQRVSRLEEYLKTLRDEQNAIKEGIKVQKERDMIDALRALRKSLKPDEECPLCGSLDHPNPFSGRKPRNPGEPESQEALQTLKHRISVAESELISAKERADRLAGRLEEREGWSDETPEIDESTVRTLRQTVMAVEQRVASRESLKKELRELRANSKPDRAKLKKMRLLRERLTATIESTESQRVARANALVATAAEFLPLSRGLEFEKILPYFRAERGRLEVRLQELGEVKYSNERAELMAETFALQLAETRASEKKRDQLLSLAAEKKETLLERFRLNFIGWDDLSFALGRSARENSVQGGEEGLLDRDTLIRTVQRQLSQSQELLATLPEPEMKAEQIRHALAREREQLETKVGRRVGLEKAVENAKSDVALYDELVERIRDQESRYQKLDFLAGLAERPEMGFHEWYLREVFSKVVTAANLRLEILAPNRFCLGLREGLEVGVVDFLAGKERPATTLSGGESFLASLALALGLGDVLQGDRGSRDRLRTLFIDEGFGYLDRRALEAALDCLESLKQEGRTVGIISHVKALRDRVRAQVVVAPNDSPLPPGVARVQIFAE